jgi:hypothetical protein
MKNVIVEAAQITRMRNNRRWITNRRVMVIYLGSGNLDIALVRQPFVFGFWFRPQTKPKTKYRCEKVALSLYGCLWIECKPAPPTHP